MIKFKLLALAFVVAGPCAYVSARRGCRPERGIAATLCAQSILLIVLGYTLPFSAVMGLLAAAGAVSWGMALVRTGKAWKKQLTLLLTPALLFAACVFLYEACAGRVFLSYDEYSHWGILPKVIALFDELPRADAGAAYIQFTYPPAGAMLPAAAMTLLGVREGMAYFGYALLLLGLGWGLCARAGKGSAVRTGLAAAMLYLVTMAVFPLSILRLFAEPLIALLMAHLIIGAYDEEENVWESGLYAVMLAMTKNTGPVFVLLALMVRLLVKRDKREARFDACALLAALAAYASYAIYCRVQGIAAVISPSHLSENLAGLFSGTLGAEYASLPARYLRFFFTSPLPDSGVYSSYGFGTCAQVTALTLLLCIAHVDVSEDRRKALRLWGGVWLANLLYTVMIVSSYFIGFEPQEVARLAEADRYSMLMPLTTGLLACAVLLGERSGARRVRYAAVVGAAFAALIPLSHMEMTVKTYVTREYVDHTVWAQDEAGKTARFIGAQLDGDEQAQVLCMGEYPYVELHCLLAGVCDVGTLDRSWEKAPWAGDAKAVESELKCGGYDYVYIGGKGEGDLAIDERYAPLTKNGEAPALRSLYRVERSEDGGAALVYMATMNEAE